MKGKSFEERARAAVERVKDEEREANERLEERLEGLRKEAAARQAERAEQERREAERRRELREIAQAEREEEEKRAMFRSWTASGGAEKDFEAAWPELRAETLKRRTLEADAAARAAQRNVSSI